MPPPACPARASFIIVAAILAIMLLHELVNPPEAVLRFSRLRRPRRKMEPQPTQMNSTLGFEKILVINLPERSDKRDAMALAAGLTNLTLDYVDGVRGQSIPDKALPLGQDERGMPENMLGSWRAHMNAIRTVVEKNLSSALILEDDSDWDLRVKQQMAQFALGTRWLQSDSASDTLTTAATTTTAWTASSARSPYGDDWDVLWLGHCVDALDETDQRTFVIENDPSAAPFDQLYHPKGMAPAWISSKPPRSRIIHAAADAICTFAYAVSQRGARRLLYDLSVKELQGLFDNALAAVCRDKPLGEKCFSPYPPLFHQHRVAGAAGKNSDNQDSTDALSTPSTDALQWPVKMNYELLLAGETELDDQYDSPADDSYDF